VRMDRRHVSGGTGQVPSIISTGVRIAGDLISDGEVHIDGFIEGDVRASSVTVSPCGRVSGALSGDTVRVEGQVDGKITGQSVSLAATARVKGDIAHDTLALEQGAHFEGHCQPVAEAKASGGSTISAIGSDTKVSKPVGSSAADVKTADQPKSSEQAA